jgi:stress response protein SCP2
MGRFDLSKGASVNLFQTGKGEELSALQVDLTWMSGADLDATAFLLGEDGVILENSDFIYYNSNCREEAFDIAKFGSKKRWRAETRPMSSDGAVLGSIDDKGDDDEDGEEASETMEVNLDKLRPSIRQIVFCISIFDETGKISFKDVRNPKIEITDTESGDVLCSYALDERFSTETAVVAGALVNNDGEWEFQAIGQGYDGGLQTLIDLYA